MDMALFFVAGGRVRMGVFIRTLWSRALSRILGVSYEQRVLVKRRCNGGVSKECRRSIKVALVEHWWITGGHRRGSVH